MLTTISDTAEATPAATLCGCSAVFRWPARVASPNAPVDQRGQGDADLHRGQEPVRVLGQPGRPLAAPPALAQRADLPLAQRDQGHLRPGEEPADEHDEQDDDDVPADRFTS